MEGSGGADGGGKRESTEFPILYYYIRIPTSTATRPLCAFLGTRRKQRWRPGEFAACYYVNHATATTMVAILPTSGIQFCARPFLLRRPQAGGRRYLSRSLAGRSGVKKARQFWRGEEACCQFGASASNGGDYCTKTNTNGGDTLWSGRPCLRSRIHPPQSVCRKKCISAG